MMFSAFAILALAHNHQLHPYLFNKAQRKAAAKEGHDWIYCDADSRDGLPCDSAWNTITESQCAGTSQSPINVTSTVYQTSDKILTLTASTCSDTEIVDADENGHTWLVEYDDECYDYESETPKAGTSYADFDDKRFLLKQFHFHSPSEHTLDGKFYPMEVHLVHVSAASELLVLGVFFEVDNSAGPNAFLEQFWDTGFDEDIEYDGKLDTYGSLLPKNRTLFHYSGSLTTPPCSEGVRWFVNANPLKFTQAQLDKFLADLAVMEQTKYADRNNRWPQPLNGRVVSLISNSNVKLVNKTKGSSGISQNVQATIAVCILAIFSILLCSFIFAGRNTRSAGRAQINPDTENAGY